MKEAEWLASDDASAMLRWARPRLSERKVRLFAAACCRAAWDRLRHPDLRQAVEYAEEYADGEGDRMVTGLADAGRLLDAGGLAPGARDAAWMARLCCTRCGAGAFDMAWPDSVGHAAKSLLGGRAADLAREVFGNPFGQLTMGQEWCELWRTPLVRSLARAAYDERLDDGTLDPARLAVLSDALEEAGCGEERLLMHLRGFRQVRDAGRPDWVEGECPHVRGCWVLDCVLGRE